MVGQGATSTASVPHAAHPAYQVIRPSRRPGRRPRAYDGTDEGVDQRRLRQPGPAVARRSTPARAPTSVRDIAERTGPPPALPGADPPRPEGRRARALEAGRRRRLRAGPAARRRSACPTSSARSTARSPSATSASPTRTVPATTRASACCWPSGTTSASRCASTSTGYTLADLVATARGERPWPAVDATDRRHLTRFALHALAARGSVESAGGSASPGRRAGATRTVRRSPVAGWSKARPAACRNGRGTVERRRGPRRRGRRPPPGGRWRPGGPGSGGCDRSRGGSRAAPLGAGRSNARHLVAGAGRAPVGRRPPSWRGLAASGRSARRRGRRRPRARPTPAPGSAARPCATPAGRRGRRRRPAVRATTSRPEVPLSRRWTMPGRCGSPTAASSG